MTRRPAAIAGEIASPAPRREASCGGPPPARGLNRLEASRYVGVSPAKFDELVREGLMPPPKCIGTRRIWDLRQVDLAFDALPAEEDRAGANTWDRFLS